jgi:uncharacterized protein (DUF3820 family)
MDPNACLRLIKEQMEDGDLDYAIDSCDDLLGWLRRGGFPPAEMGLYCELAIDKVMALREGCIRRGGLSAAKRRA